MLLRNPDYGMYAPAQVPGDSCGFNVCHIIQNLPTPASGYGAAAALAMYKYGHCEVEEVHYIYPAHWS